MALTRDIVSVSWLNQHVKQLLESSLALQGLMVRGEVSNFRRYPNALYFSIKDIDAKISAVMFLYQSFPAYLPKDGDEVIITGSVSLYTKEGSYQFIAKNIEAYGEGDQLLALKRLKEKLAKEGLFDASRKRPLKWYPERIGIIAAKDSAALKDITFNLSRRYPIAHIFIFPSRVQGKDAVRQLIDQLDIASTYPLDVLILARGGGAEEDLSAFNDEGLTRKVVNAPFPIVAAIGHEINLSLVDLAADKRASTPTAAAELVARDQFEISQDLQAYRERAFNRIRDIIHQLSMRFEYLKKHRLFIKPDTMFVHHQTRLNQLKLQNEASLQYWYYPFQVRLQKYKQALSHLSPTNILKRG
jgi:exodeoxyribonuclease VII large subunit